jgi:histidinol-phosphate aminotransferase
MKATDIQKLVRPNILKLQAYSSARSEFTGSDGIFLDANENPFGTLNRYPDPLQKELKNKLSVIKKIPSENIFIGNGSDEVIDLVFRVFCNPGKDKVLAFYPTYGMYEVSAGINDTELIYVPLDKDFQVDFEGLGKYLSDERLKIIFVCSPNNPTGNIITGIERILEQFKGIVLVDEAYMDFAETGSLIDKIDEYPNLIVSQTFSKARGLAAARVGIAFAGSEIISLFNKVKPPYNVSGLNQQAALKTLNSNDEYQKIKTLILEQKAMLMEELPKFSIVEKVFPSDANFILAEMKDAGKVYQELIKSKIITRNRSKQVNNCLRITVGKPEENRTLLKALKNIKINS